MVLGPRLGAVGRELTVYSALFPGARQRDSTNYLQMSGFYCADAVRALPRNSAIGRTFIAIALSRGEETLAVNFGTFDSERPVAGKGRSPKFTQHHSGTR
jgi:hypothetical protein